MFTRTLKQANIHATSELIPLIEMNCVASASLTCLARSAACEEG